MEPVERMMTVRSRQVDIQAVEQAIRQQPGVADAVVRAFPLPDQQVQLRCYYVSAPEAGITTAWLRRNLRRVLPIHMVPAHFYALDWLPRAQDGDVDEGALPMPHSSRPDLPMPYLAPSSEAEQILADIWAEVLGLDLVGVHDSFLDLGGDSLLAARAVASISYVLDVDLTPSRLLEATTVSIMAELVEHRLLEQMPTPEVESLLTKIEALTEEQAQQLLDSRP